MLYEKTNVEDVSTENKIGKVVGCVVLAVREAPSSDSDVLALVSKDDELEITGSITEGWWYPVCTVAGIEGYCMGTFIEVSS